MSRIVLALLFLTSATAFADDWPQWRGPARTGISKETGLLKTWPADGPNLRWKNTDIGTGYSTPAVVKGRVYVQTTDGEEESVLVLDEKTGQKIWKKVIGKVGKNSGPPYPGTRATPTIDGDRLYCLASDGELVCLDAMGEMKWQKHLKKDFEGKVGFWQYSESVLIDGDVLVCTPGGPTAGLVALNKMNGAVIWKTEIPGGSIADYASVMAVETEKGKEYVQFFREGVVGVDAKTGQFLWKYAATADFGANIMTPVILKNRVFTSGSRSGGGLVEVVYDEGKVAAKQLYFEKALGASIGGAILVDGNIYGASQAGIFCADFATGKTKWTERSVGTASLCVADGRLYAGGFKGEVALIELNPEKYVEHGRFKRPDRSKIDAWPHPIVANGGLYLRDQGVLLCYDVADKK